MKDNEKIIKRVLRNNEDLHSLAGTQRIKKALKEALAEKEKPIRTAKDAVALELGRDLDWLKLLAEKDKEIERLKNENDGMALDIKNFEIHEGLEIEHLKSQLQEWLKIEIKKAENIREDRFDTASVSVGVKNKQFHRTAVKYKGMVIAFNKVLKLLEEKPKKEEE